MYPFVQQDGRDTLFKVGNNSYFVIPADGLGLDIIAAFKPVMDSLRKGDDCSRRRENSSFFINKV